MSDILAHIATCGVAMIEGPIGRAGATGLIESVPIYGSDENHLEIANRARD